jgi:hypothetical protein
LFLLVEQFVQLHLRDIALDECRADLLDLAARLTACCRDVDRASTYMTPGAAVEFAPSLLFPL